MKKETISSLETSEASVMLTKLNGYYILAIENDGIHFNWKFSFATYAHLKIVLSLWKNNKTNLCESKGVSLKRGSGWLPGYFLVINNQSFAITYEEVEQLYLKINT